MSQFSDLDATVLVGLRCGQGKSKRLILEMLNVNLKWPVDQPQRLTSLQAAHTSPSGIWQLDPGPGLLRIVEVGNGRYQLSEGWRNEDGTKGWVEPIELRLVGDNLEAEFRSHNFRATQGTEFNYHMIVALSEAKELVYTVKSSLGDEIKRAKRTE